MTLLVLLVFILQQVNELYPTSRELVITILLRNPIPSIFCLCFLFPHRLSVSSLIVWECKGKSFFYFCKTFLKYFFILF